MRGGGNITHKLQVHVLKSSGIFLFLKKHTGHEVIRDNEALITDRFTNMVAVLC